jgi:hypothetical protein
MSKFARLVSLAFVGPLLSWAQSSVPVQITVTVGHHYSHQSPTLTREDLTLVRHFEPLAVANVIPLRGDHAGFDLFLLVDHCSNCEPGSKFDELSRFIGSQPATTAIGVAYIQNGRLQIAENPTTDHKRAIQALDTPEGSKPASPFLALAELIRTWPQGSAQRVVLMISNGINPTTGDAMRDPSAEAALEAAQRAGVTVYAIYHPSAGYDKSDLSKLYAEQVQLAHVADETGGEAYFLGFGPLPSLGPFLSDLADHFANRYLIEFVAPPAAGSGELQQVTVKGKTAEIEIMAPDKVWVRGRHLVSSNVDAAEGARR